MSAFQADLDARLLGLGAVEERIPCTGSCGHATLPFVPSRTRAEAGHRPDVSDLSVAGLEPLARAAHPHPLAASSPS